MFKSLLPALALILPVAARAALPGTWEGPLGAVQISADGSTLTGKLLEPSPGVPLKKGEELLRGTLAGDTVAVQVLVPLTGCGKREVWAAGMLLTAMEGNLLTGAVHVDRGCKSAVLGKNGGLALRRVPDDLVAEALADLRSAAPPPKHVARKERPKAASATEAGDRGVQEAALERTPLGVAERASVADDGLKKLRRARAQTILREGASYLDEGRFEQAREKFLEAIEVDPTVAEAYNGVGVSYYGRQQRDEAEKWYRRALAVDPDFPDAWYNLACLDALAGRKDRAFRLLDLAVKNGYTTDASLDRDPDLAGLRSDPRFARLRKRGSRP